MHTYWRRQEPDTPLFPEILWSRPETKHGAGKLAILGGNAHAIGAPGTAYNQAQASGAGVIKVLMPEAVKKTVKLLLPDADFAPSNPSGSFSKQAMADFMEVASWSDMTLLAGDFGRNSETAVLLEDFVQKYNGPMTITQDAVDYFKALPNLLLKRPNTTIVLSLAQLQRLFINAAIMTPITYGMSLQQLAEALRQLTESHGACIVVKHHDTIFVGYQGQIISTSETNDIWRVTVASRASVFWMQNPANTLESIVTSLANIVD